MAKVERSITINASVEQVFAYIEDPMNDVEHTAGVIEIKDVTGSGVGAHNRWVYKMAGLRFEGESTVTEHIPNERIVTQTKGGIASTWTYTFEPHDGGTKLTVNVEYTIPVPVLGKLAEKLVLKRNEREADLNMANIKESIEGRTSASQT